MPFYTVQFYEETACSTRIEADTPEQAIDLFRMGEWNQKDVESTGAEIDYEDVHAYQNEET